MDFDDGEAMDIEEARLIISLKNDEINNLKSSVKANQIRNNLKIADFQYKMEHLQNKASMAESKAAKADQNLKKLKQKFEQQQSKLQSQIQKLKQTIQQTLSMSRQKQRELKGAIYQQKMRLQKEKQQNYKWNSEFQVITKYFDTKKILALLQKERLEDIPSYVQLYKKYVDGQEIIRHSDLQLSTMRSQIMSQMQQSFQKLSSYESVMWDLKIKNEQLRVQIDQKETELQLRSLEINQRKSLLEEVEKEANSQISHLSSELITLRTQYESYHEEQNQVRGRSRSDSFYMQKIQDIEQTYWMKQSQYSQQFGEYEDKIAKLEQENRLLKIQLEQTQARLAETQQLQIVTSQNYARQLEDEKKVIALMDASLKDQEEYTQQLKRENQKLVKELNQIMIQKRKLVQQHKLVEQEYRTMINSLNQELKYLQSQTAQNKSQKQSHSSNHRQQLNDLSLQDNSQHQAKVLKRVMSGEASVNNLGKSTNLLYDLNDKFQIQINGEEIRSNADIGHYQEDPTWPQKYYCLLQKHNVFIKKVFGRLKGLKERKI